MLENINIESILFLDIETVSQQPHYDLLDGVMSELWDKKSRFFKRENPDETSSTLYPRAGIYAEFGKIICISVGFIRKIDGVNKLRLKSFYGHDEKKLLSEFIDLVDTYYNRMDSLLCAHNGKEFDYPYIARRILINGLKMPFILDLPGKKPWEVALLDTMDLWKFGDYKNYTSLDLLASVLNIPTPKDDMDGSMVNKVYWEDKNLSRIVEYCRKDVVTVAQIVLKFKSDILLASEDLLIIEE